MSSNSRDRDVEAGEAACSSSSANSGAPPAYSEEGLPSYYEGTSAGAVGVGRGQGGRRGGQEGRIGGGARQGGGGAGERLHHNSSADSVPSYSGDGAYRPLSPSSNRHYLYNEKVGKMAGLLQVLCGSVTAVMGLLALVLHAHDYFLDLPLWAGLLYLFSGVFGVSTSKQQNFMVGLYLLFSIMSSMMSSIVVVTEGHATFMEANHCDCSIFQSSHMLYDATAALFSCVELVVSAVSMYHCMAGLGCCTCCIPPPREPRDDISHPPTLLDFSNIPLPPAPIYPVMAPELPDKVPLE